MFVICWWGIVCNLCKVSRRFMSILISSYYNSFNKFWKIWRCCLFIIDVLWIRLKLWGFLETNIFLLSCKLSSRSLKWRFLNTPSLGADFWSERTCYLNMLFSSIEWQQQSSVVLWAFFLEMLPWTHLNRNKLQEVLITMTVRNRKITHLKKLYWNSYLREVSYLMGGWPATSLFLVHFCHSLF